MAQNFKGVVKLSKENYLTLSTDGELTLKDGSILTYDPSTTMYITDETSADFTEQDKEKVDIINILGDGTQFLSNDGTYKTINIENDIETLTGTDDSPINAPQVEAGRYYYIQGRLGSKVVPSRSFYFADPTLVFVYGSTTKYFILFGVELKLGSGSAEGSISYKNDISIATSHSYGGGFGSAQSLKHISKFNGSSTEENISFYAPTVSGDSGQVLQSNGSNSTPTWVDLPDALPQLNGTEDTPINLYNDLDVNKLYSVGGVIYNSDSNLTATSSILIYKADSNRLYLIGGKIDLVENEIYFQPGYFTLAEIEATGEISTHQTSIAPVNSGTIGQVLTSNGPDEAPTWQNSSATTLSNGAAHLSLTSGEGDVAYLTCDKPLYVGTETQDLTFDCHTLQIMTEDGWAIQSYVTNEDEEDSGSFTFQFGNITLANSNQAIHLNKASDQIIMQASAVRSNGTNTDLGTSDAPWNNMYANNIYQNGSKVLTQNDNALYKHNVSLNGTSDSGKKINARVVCLTRSNVLITTYGQLVNSITGAVDYPINGYVYDENDNFFGTIIYFDYNIGNIFEFTVATPNGVETISLSTAQITIADTAVSVE